MAIFQLCVETSVYLVDTSAWILHFSTDSSFDLRTICPPEERAICLPVYQEILQGIRDEKVYRHLREILLAGDIVENPLTIGLFDEAVGLYRLARKNGLTIRSSVDCLIAACAIRHDLTILHNDRGFAALSAISTLKQMNIKK